MFSKLNFLFSQVTCKNHAFLLEAQLIIKTDVLLLAKERHARAVVLPPQPFQN